MLDFLLHSSQCEEASYRTCGLKLPVDNYSLFKGKTLEVKRSQNIVPVSDGQSTSIRGDSSRAVQILLPVSSSHYTKVNGGWNLFLTSAGWSDSINIQVNICTGSHTVSDGVCSGIRHSFGKSFVFSTRTKTPWFMHNGGRESKRCPAWFSVNMPKYLCLCWCGHVATKYWWEDKIQTSKPSLKCYQIQKIQWQFFFQDCTTLQ